MRKIESDKTIKYISNELLPKLGLRLNQVTYDIAFPDYTKKLRPDICISNVDYNNGNDVEFVSNLIAYIEVKDGFVVGDKDYKDAFKQGISKSKKLKMPFFILTNLQNFYFFNTKTQKELKINGSHIRTLDNIDLLRLIKRTLKTNSNINDIQTNTDTETSLNENNFLSKLDALNEAYRNTELKNSDKIDFSIGFIALKFFEEKCEKMNTKDESRDYWSDLKKDIKKPSSFIAKLDSYIKFAEESELGVFKDKFDFIRERMDTSKKKHVPTDKIIKIYNEVDAMGTLHGGGFDLFGAVYERFANKEDKKAFGEFFTRRNYTHVFTKLLLQGEKYYNAERKFYLSDLTCGTGGFLTEAFKILKKSYSNSGTLTEDAIKFLSTECIYGYDYRDENVEITKLNMFLIGDGHNHIYKRHSLREEFDKDKFDYILGNPPYGNGDTLADTDVISTQRYEYAFLIKIIKTLKVGGKSCLVLPDGFFENPSSRCLRELMLSKCKITAIVSLPLFAFAPYTKEKTYAIFFEKTSEEVKPCQTDDIWMYIIDNDGLANSDKKFPTNLRDSNNKWLHDETRGYIDIDGNEQVSILEERWLTYDDSTTNGTEFINEKGETVKLRKGGFVSIDKISKNNFNLLPEYYFRPFEPHYISLEELTTEISKISTIMSQLNKLDIKTIKEELGLNE